MKKAALLLFVVVLFVSSAGFAFAQVRVHGYTRSDGTYVAPHVRSAPNSTPTDNYTFKGNTNPYTGQQGSDYYRSNPKSPYYDGRSSGSRSNGLFGE
jgi:hypothetical protein